MTICNATSTAMTYASVTGSILSEDARRKSFEQNTSGDAYTVQDTGDRSKSRDKRICNYFKKPGHIKADCRALKAKNEKAQRAGKPNHTKEVNYCGSTSTAERVTTEDTHILTVESITEAEVLLTTEESTS